MVISDLVGSCHSREEANSALSGMAALREDDLCYRDFTEYVREPPVSNGEEGSLTVGHPFLIHRAELTLTPT